MKRIIPNTAPTNVVTINDVRSIENPIIGVSATQYGKLTLVPKHYRSNLYYARLVDGWENGNGWLLLCSNENSLENWIKHFLETEEAELFLFDSPKELFGWLAK